MDADRFELTLQIKKDEVPFRPFTLVMMSGRSYEIDNPRILHMSEGTAVYFLPGGIPLIFDHESVSEIVNDLKSHADRQHAA